MAQLSAQFIVVVVVFILFHSSENVHVHVVLRIIQIFWYFILLCLYRVWLVQLIAVSLH